jgi:hypothetical protein
MRDSFDVHPLGRLERDILFFLAPPFDGFEIDAVVILQNAAHPQPGGILQSVEGDPLAVEIGRFLDAAAGSFHHVLMPKATVWKYRNGVVVASFVTRHKITYQREFTNVELLMPQHPTMALRRRHRENVEIDALWLNFTVD